MRKGKKVSRTLRGGPYHWKTVPLTEGVGTLTFTVCKWCEERQALVKWKGYYTSFGEWVNCLKNKAK